MSEPTDDTGVLHDPDRAQKRFTEPSHEVEPAPEPPAKRPLKERLRPWLIVVAILALVVVALDVVTSSPAVCASCHEMKLRATQWAASGHAEIECVQCHAPSYTWYRYPAALAVRTGRLVRDVYLHTTAAYVDPVDERTGHQLPVTDAACLQCHDPERRATSGFAIKIKHAEHAKRNKSCVSCHLRTAHPVPTRSKALVLMAQCFTCHGQPDKPKATTKCSLCHPEGFDLAPQSHASTKWRRGHGRVSAQDRELCALCHEQTFCDACHGLEMPHPSDWARGKTGHAAVASKQRELCAKCHTEKPDLCSMCHHEAYEPKRGTWVEQHRFEVMERGASFCFDCHVAYFCQDCHLR